MPVVEPTVAFTAVLVHTPPRVASLSVIIPPSHTTGVPVIAAGVAPTVTTVVITQPAVFI